MAKGPGDLNPPVGVAYNYIVGREKIEVKVDLLGERMSINVPPVPMKVCGSKEPATRTYVEAPVTEEKPRRSSWLSTCSRFLSHSGG